MMKSQSPGENTLNDVFTSASMSELNHDRSPRARPTTLNFERNHQTSVRQINEKCDDDAT